MRIACPSCAVTYEVPDSRLKPGRMVRCARCDRQWMPLAPEDTAPPEEPPAAAVAPFEPPPEEAPAPPRPTVSAMDLLAAHRKRQEPVRGLRAAWIASIVLLVGLLLAGLLWREAVQLAWPPSRRLYGVVGLGLTGAPPPASQSTPPAGPPPAKPN